VDPFTTLSASILNIQKPFVVDKAIKPVWKLHDRQVLFDRAFACRGQLVLHKSDIDDRIRTKMFGGDVT